MNLQRFHSYVLSFGAIAFGANLPLAFQVDTGFDFIWMKASAFIYDAAGLGVSTLLLPRLTVVLQDGSTKQQITDGEVPVASLFGTGQIPYILPLRHRIVGGATFNAQVFNRHTATAFGVDLVFSGAHVQRGALLDSAASKKG
jgi:hypothetical protein